MVCQGPAVQRIDIVRQFLAESVLISVGGGPLGTGFGFFLARLTVRPNGKRS
jgi:ABC-type antimicrobial peptide transport system permease subunit